MREFRRIRVRAIVTSMIAAIIQARMGSERFPGKVAKDILGKPMLQHEIERLKTAKLVDKVLVATTDKQKDDAVAEIATMSGVEYFRGSEKDVLHRFYEAAVSSNADVVVRVTGDCPLHDPDVLDLVVRRFRDMGVDYAKTPANYPEGLDTEVFSFTALELANKNARLPSEREHVTPYLRNHPEMFKLDYEWTLGDFNHSSYHWSVDTAEDFWFVEKVYEYLYKKGSVFHMQDIVALLKARPELTEINKGGTGYEGLEKSRLEDEKFMKHHG